MDKPRGHYAKWNKLVKKWQILWLYDIVIMIIWFHLFEVRKVVKIMKRERRTEVAKGEGRGEWGVIVNGYRISHFRMKRIIGMGDGDVCNTKMWMYLIHKMIKMVNFMLCH